MHHATESSPFLGFGFTIKLRPGTDIPLKGIGSSCGPEKTRTDILGDECQALHLYGGRKRNDRNMQVRFSQKVNNKISGRKYPSTCKPVFETRFPGNSGCFSEEYWKNLNLLEECKVRHFSLVSEYTIVWIKDSKELLEKSFDDALETKSGFTEGLKANRKPGHRNE